MKVKLNLLVLASLALISACGSQLNNQNSSTGVPQTEPSFVKGADGSLYDMSCTRANGAAILQGTFNPRDCITSQSSGTQNNEVRGERSFYYYYYYPPTYYNYSGYNNGYYNYNYNSYTNNNFCSYFLGSAWNNNYSCYNNVFGYQPSYNYNSYNSSCYQCLGYYSSCYNSCYGYGY